MALQDVREGQKAPPVTAVREGQQYCQVNGTGKVWQVRQVYGDPGGIQHARLFNVADPVQVKTLTCNVLTDPDFYRLMSDYPAVGSARRLGRRF